MQKVCLFLLGVFAVVSLEASWYWPFGSDDDDPPRLSELVRKSSELIGEASDLAAEGKVTEAVEKYQEALDELSRVEREHPELAEKVAGGTIKTKRAYVEAAIDSLLMNQVRENAKPVAVSDTTALERRLKEERGEKIAAPTVVEAPKEVAVRKVVETALARAKKAVAPQKKPVARAKKATRAPQTAQTPKTPRDEAVKAISSGDYEKATRLIDALLNERPNDAAALNLRAVCAVSQGDARAAEAALDRAIQSNPRDYHAFYNMAILKLETRQDDRDGARRYYETGRALGGPRDEAIEEMLK